jgi:hypothetical protein
LATGTIPWSRVVLEGVVIVFSILLAFGIDAWWDDRANREETREGLEAIRIELLENLDRLEEHAQFCMQVRVATDALLSLMGPSPEVVSSDSVLGLVAGALDGGIGNRLSTTALDAMIAEGQFASIESAELRRSLGSWLSSAVDQRIQQRDNARVQLRETRAYAQTVMPFALVAGGYERVATPHQSRFLMNVVQVLSDPRLEGAVSQLGVSRESICRYDSARREEAERLISEIDAELAG